MNQEKEDRGTVINRLRLSRSYLDSWSETGEDRYRRWFLETMEEYKQLRESGIANPQWVNGNHIIDGDEYYSLLVTAYQTERDRRWPPNSQHIRT